MSSPHRGRNEHGQNFLHDRGVIDTVVEIVARTDGPILEVGAGDGALTLPLQRLGRPLTAIEVDARRAARLAKRTSVTTRVVDADFLHYRLPHAPHVIVGNLPFHLTTAMLRRILHGPGWTDAVLLVQWEVARRRAAVGGATMMTAQWWPWFEFALVRRVSAASFRPRPTVDGGLMTVHRRTDPLVDSPIAGRIRRWCIRCSPAAGTASPRSLTPDPRPLARQWLRNNDIRASALPRDLSAAQWADLFALSAGR